VIEKNGDNIYALSVHPGTVNTAMQQPWKDAYPGLFGKIITAAMLAGGRDVEQGSYSAVGKPGKESSQASDPALGAALWELSERIIKHKVGPDAIVDWDKHD